MGERTYEEFANWFRRVNRSSPPPEGIAEFYVGLFESEGGYMAYLTGSSKFDPDDDGWVGREDYVPAEKYFEMHEGFPTGTDWRKVQRDVVGLVKRFIESPDSADSFLARASGVVVGFDDGEVERVA
jgi:hypothetical protein